MAQTGKIKDLDSAAFDYIHAVIRRTSEGPTLDKIAAHLSQECRRKITRYVARGIVRRLAKAKKIVCTPRKRGGLAMAAPLPGPETLRTLPMWTIYGSEDVTFMDRRATEITYDDRMLPLRRGGRHFLVRIFSNDYIALRVKQGGVFVVREFNARVKRLSGTWCLVRIGDNVGLRRVEYSHAEERAVVRRFRARGGVILSGEGPIRDNLRIYGVIESAFCPGVGTNMKEFYGDQSFFPRDDQPFTRKNSAQY